MASEPTVQITDLNGICLPLKLTVDGNRTRILIPTDAGVYWNGITLEAGTDRKWHFRTQPVPPDTQCEMEEDGHVRVIPG